MGQGPRAPKRSRATAMTAATDDGSIDQSNQFSSLYGMKYCHNFNSIKRSENVREKLA